MITLLITIICKRNNFQEIIEKPREFIEFYGKYDYFHFYAFLAFMNATHFVRISEPNQRREPLPSGAGEPSPEANAIVRRCAMRRRISARSEESPLAKRCKRRSFILEGGEETAPFAPGPWFSAMKNLASLVSAPSRAGPDSTDEGEFGASPLRAHDTAVRDFGNDGKCGELRVISGR